MRGVDLGQHMCHEHRLVDTGVIEHGRLHDLRKQSALGSAGGLRGSPHGSDDESVQLVVACEHLVKTFCSELCQRGLDCLMAAVVKALGQRRGKPYLGGEQTPTQGHLHRRGYFGVIHSNETRGRGRSTRGHLCSFCVRTLRHAPVPMRS